MMKVLRSCVKGQVMERIGLINNPGTTWRLLINRVGLIKPVRESESGLRDNEFIPNTMYIK